MWPFFVVALFIGAAAFHYKHKPKCLRWSAIKDGVPQAVSNRANELLHTMTMGDVRVEVYNGKAYRYVKETHPADSGISAPHPGVTVFECIGE